MNHWNAHMCSAGAWHYSDVNPPEDPNKTKKDIEPWLSAVFQSEHLSLLLGSGFSRGIAGMARAESAKMGKYTFSSELSDKVDDHARLSAEACGRGEPNFEDQIRVANQLLAGLKVMGDPRKSLWIGELNKALSAFLHAILDAERDILAKLKCETTEAELAGKTLISFVLSFASRAASRDRLNLFTTNYDRLVEFACDFAGIRVIDRFVGALVPIFRSSRINVDLHYNPPGIRGEPRYLEGVIKLIKLHGSVDWRFEDSALKRYAIPFGAPTKHPDIPCDPVDSVIIYPNAAKDVETIDFPYAELFRDFAAALCRPNSSLVTYGYGFGDDHINRVITDMLTIPSTHLVIISRDDPGNRIKSFCEKGAHKAQISLLLGSHFGDIGTLVQYYLPKPAVDPITWRWAALLKQRGIVPGTLSNSSDDDDPEGENGAIEPSSERLS
jgi:hypothetical protein